MLASTLAKWVVESNHPVVQLPPFRHSPLNRQVALVLAELLNPDQILVGDQGLARMPWPVGPEEFEFASDFPAVVKQAHRKAKWLQVIESCSRFEVPLHSVFLEGARLGAGEYLSSTQLEAIGLSSADYVESSGGTALVISETLGADENMLSRIMNVTHTHRVQLVNPVEYEGLLCSFARDTGEDFGFGRIVELNVQSGLLVIESTAIPPDQVRLIRLGSLIVDKNGNERTEHKPWSL